MTTRTASPRARWRHEHRLYRVTQTSTGTRRTRVGGGFASMGAAAIHAERSGPGVYEIERIRIEGRAPDTTESLVRRKTHYVSRDRLTADEQADLRERVAVAPQHTEEQLEAVMSRFDHPDGRNVADVYEEHDQ